MFEATVRFAVEASPRILRVAAAHLTFCFEEKIFSPNGRRFSAFLKERTEKVLTRRTQEHGTFGITVANSFSSTPLDFINVLADTVFTLTPPIFIQIGSQINANATL